MPLAPVIPLNTGASIPQIGLGTAPMTDDKVVPAIVAAAAAGLRLTRGRPRPTDRVGH